MAVNWLRLKADIVEAAVRAVNATLYMGEERALHDVPVRKIFKGGKQTVRFKTAAEIEADKGLRSRLGLAPEILATPEAIARVQAAGLNPKKSSFVGGNEFGFARTISHPSSDSRRLTRGAIDALGLPAGIVDKEDIRRHLQQHGSGKTRAERGFTQNRSNRANDFMPFGEDMRVIKTGSPNRMADEGAQQYLTARGRYELSGSKATGSGAGRAISQRTKQVATVAIQAGKVTVTGTDSVGVGPERLGGGLRSTIRVIKASPDSYPVIEGSLVAGDKDHDYAKYQELGTRHNAAHPFLRPRLPEWREELPAQLRRSLGRTGR